MGIGRILYRIYNLVFFSQLFVVVWHSLFVGLQFFLFTSNSHNTPIRSDPIREKRNIVNVCPISYIISKPLFFCATALKIFEVFKVLKWANIFCVVYFKSVLKWSLYYFVCNIRLCSMISHHIIHIFIT